MNPRMRAPSFGVGVEVDVEESTPNHWVAAWNDIVLLVAYEGSSSDVGHVQAGARAIERMARRYPGKTRFLFVLPPRHAKPPDAHVRTALFQTAKRLEANVDRAAVVIAGEGFVAAVHRGAATGILAIIRPRIVVKITSNTRDALQFLGGTSDGIDSLMDVCEPHFSGPG